MGHLRLNILFSLALLTVAFAGCAEDAAPPQANAGEPQSIEKLELKATKETGIIRGVVVDNAVVPIGDATITIVSSKITTTSLEDGGFGFGNVEPGVHQLTVDAIGYNAVTTAVTVEAGVDKPQIVRVQLDPAPSELPFAEPFTFNGFIACSASTPAYRVAVCGAFNIVTDILGQPPLTDDEFIIGFEMQPGPMFIQAEMIWKGTQPAGDFLLLTVERESTAGADIGSESGSSPLILKADNATIEAAGMTNYMQQRVFNHEHPLTTPPVPVCDVPNPVHGGTMCVKGWGLTVDQSFQVFTHNFHKFLPTEGWTFLEDGSPVPPA